MILPARRFFCAGFFVADLTVGKRGSGVAASGSFSSARKFR